MFEINEEGKAVGNAIGLVKAINWLVKERVEVVNMSIAAADNKIVRTAVGIAKRKGLVMVAAASNWGRTRPAYPAAYDDVLTITAVSIKKKVYARANRGAYIDFAAPGVRMWTAVPGGGRYQSGTSFAAPYVTSLVALAVAHGADKDAKSLRTMLRRGVLDLGAKGRDEVFGWGYVTQRPRCAK